MIAARAEATRIVVESDHPRRLIVSGPGTGKSYAFKLALQRKGERGLALTFIRTLAAELAKDLVDDADTFTFHAYSKHLFHRLSPHGLTREFSLYPPLFTLITEDLGVLGAVTWSPAMGERVFEELQSSVERTIMDLDPSSRIPERVLRLGTYYDATSFIDLVYRVFLHLEDHPDATPEYPLVVVDEYQDFSRLETAFIAQLGLKSPLLIAGDDDQALYKFRHASAEHIRNLAASSDVERHVLPYCSRCTSPVVAAVHATIARAVALGHMRERLDKPFECYLPDKEGDSRRYPEIIDARCSIHRYMGQYVETEIAKISQEDIDASVAGRHKTVLVVGPKQFIRPIYQRLHDGRYPQAELRVSDPLPVTPIDGFRRIARSSESNLGWRILIHCQPFRGWIDALRDALTSGDRLMTRLPAAWRDERLAVAQLLGRALDGETLSDPELDRLAEAVEMGRDALRDYVQAGEPQEEEGEATTPPTPVAEPSGLAPPSILCTTLKGAKGLSAEHVFVVGLMNGHFPDRGAAPSDEEICEFLVALSRTRKQCHLVSTRIFAGPPPLRPSVFLSWVSGQTRQITVDRRYW
jgi:hypothetical protein